MSAQRGTNVAIVGVTGLVGRTLLRVLEERRFPVTQLRLFASARSAGETIEALGSRLDVIALDDAPVDALADVDVAFFAAGNETSTRYAKKCADAGSIVIDKSSAFRLAPRVPLVVPEVNGSSLGEAKLIANPNCATIPLAVTLAPIARNFGLTWASVATYQSVSGAGAPAVEEFERQLDGDSEVRVLPQRIVGNVIPENGPFDESGDGEEESKIVAELRKILAFADLPLSATSVRVPVHVGHCAALSFGVAARAGVGRIADALRRAPGVRFLEGSAYATPLDIAGSDDVAVGRLREDRAHLNAFSCWVACDNLRKGAATNAVQIAELALGMPSKVPA